MAMTWSYDQGRSWESVRPLFDYGVFPCLLLLGNGTMVLSFGRPGVHLAVASDGCGRRWETPISLIEGNTEELGLHSCGYTSLLPLSNDSFMIAYSDFTYEREGGCFKAIVTQVVRVTPGGDA